ncbi:MAG: DUF2812 domain-containing protein [Clostridiaceae bacterium]
MKKISFRPLWSLDIIKTEKYLSDMAKKGYKLAGINYIAKIFKFEKGESKDINYKITYSKDYGNKLATSLINDGWKTCSENKRWRVQVNENEKSSIKKSPSRDGIWKRNKKIFEILQSLIFVPLPIMIINTITMFMHGGIFNKNSTISYKNNVIIIGTPNSYSEIYYYDLISYAVLIIIIILAVISSVILFKGNKKLKSEIGQVEEVEEFEEVKISNKVEKIRKNKLGWEYQPDLIEKWLEDMEYKGFNLCKVDINSFSFIKGERKKIKYYIDSQKSPGEGYYDIYLSSGYKLVNSDEESSKTCTIWKKEYNENEVEPIMYNDSSIGINIAKKRMLYLPMNIFLIIIFTATLKFIIELIINYKIITNANALKYVMYFLALPLIIFIIVYTFIVSMKIIKYYFRLKGKINK